MTDCLFCKIIAGSIPAKKVYEDEKVFAFEDIKPGAPTHVLIVPRKHIAGVDQLTEADTEIVGYSHLVAARLARERGLKNGFRTVYNVGPDAGQTVFHLHLHLLGGRQMHWPPG
jgi:histidine triad (HIT) family protein